MPKAAFEAFSLMFYFGVFRGFFEGEVRWFGWLLFFYYWGGGRHILPPKKHKIPPQKATQTNKNKLKKTPPQTKQLHSGYEIEKPAFLNPTHSPVYTHSSISQGILWSAQAWSVHSEGLRETAGVRKVAERPPNPCRPHQGCMLQKHLQV